MSFSSDPSSIYISTVHYNPFSHASANADFPPHPRLKTSYSSFGLPLASSYVSTLPFFTSGSSSMLLLPLLFLICLGFCNKMQEVFLPEMLNVFTLIGSLLSILTLFRSLTLTLLHFSESLDTLVCKLIALTPSLAFLHQMTRALFVMLSSLSDRAHPFLNSQPPLSFRLITTWTTLGSTFC